MLGPEGQALQGRLATRVLAPSGARECQVRVVAEGLPTVAGFAVRVEVTEGDLGCVSAKPNVPTGERSIACGQPGEGGRIGAAAGASLDAVPLELADFAFSGTVATSRTPMGTSTWRSTVETGRRARRR